MFCQIKLFLGSSIVEQNEVGLWATEFIYELNLK